MKSLLAQVFCSVDKCDRYYRHYLTVQSPSLSHSRIAWKLGHTAETSFAVLARKSCPTPSTGQILCLPHSPSFFKCFILIYIVNFIIKFPLCTSKAAFPKNRFITFNMHSCSQYSATWPPSAAVSISKSYPSHQLFKSQNFLAKQYSNFFTTSVFLAANTLLILLLPNTCKVCPSFNAEN